jgi:UPF0288 family protein (methanogenesis marker protein 3)
MVLIHENIRRGRIYFQNIDQGIFFSDNTPKKTKALFKENTPKQILFKV